MQKIPLLITISLIAGALLSACGPSQPEATPTPGLDQIQTSVVQTLEVNLTQTALAKPTATVTSTPAATSTPFPIPTLALGTPLPPVATSAGTGSTCTKLVYIKDVTIPDNTPMTAGQSFTKTWQVQNSGSCAWDIGFKFALIGGNDMGGQTLTLSEAVAPGATYEISIPMTAPTNKTGTISGTWRMSDATGAYFGNPLTVVIVIAGSGSGSGTPTATPAIIIYP